jgi:hypothetical protein
MAKRPQIHPEQIFMPLEPPTIYGSPGSYVSLEDRAEHLQDALAAIGRMNQRLGFDTASNAKQYNRPIRERYRGALPAVQLGARDNEMKFFEEVRRSFWQSTGYIALRDSRPRLASRKEMDSGARKMWRDFCAEYGHTANREKRDTYKRQLAHTVKRVRPAGRPAASQAEAA